MRTVIPQFHGVILSIYLMLVTREQGKNFIHKYCIQDIDKFFVINLVNGGKRKSLNHLLAVWKYFDHNVFILDVKVMSGTSTYMPKPHHHTKHI